MDYSTLVSTQESRFSGLSSKQVDFIRTIFGSFIFVFQFRVTVTARSSSIFMNFINFHTFHFKRYCREDIVPFFGSARDSMGFFTHTPITERLRGWAERSS